MAEVKDCGDVTFTVNLTIGVKYDLISNDKDAQKVRTQRAQAVAAFRGSAYVERLEKAVMAELLEYLGYNEESIRAELAKREEMRRIRREAEEKGRRERHERRVKAGV